MCVQLDSKTMCKRSKKEGRPPNYCAFWNKEVHYTKHPSKKTLMFESYNLLDPIEQGVVIVQG
jgi:hypothetical protein